MKKKSSNAYNIPIIVCTEPLFSWQFRNYENKEWLLMDKGDIGVKSTVVIKMTLT